MEADNRQFDGKLFLKDVNRKLKRPVGQKFKKILIRD